MLDKGHLLLIGGAFLALIYFVYAILYVFWQDKKIKEILDNQDENFSDYSEPKNTTEEKIK